jgi:alpha-beta hydrolase superfamily lysophospholipase
MKAVRFGNLLPLLATGLLGAAGGLVGAAYYISQRVNPRPVRQFVDDYTFTPWELGVPYEVLDIVSADGLRLRGWWLGHAEDRAVVVGSHGHTGRKEDLLGIGTNLWRAGFSVLLFDYRGRGESDAWAQTLVSREVDDLQAAVAAAARRAPGAPLGVIGFSMGAAVALLAAADNPQITAVVADSSFTSGADVVTHGVNRELRIPAGPLVRVADELVARLHGYRFSQVQPVAAVARLAPRPLLIVHGDRDSVIPVSHAHQLHAAAAEPRELWIVAGVEHCGAYFADRPAYCRRVIEFFDRYLRSIEAGSA